MSTEVPCRQCGETVTADELTCPHCGAARPAFADWRGEGFEWKTRATWLGTPLVHVAFGIDASGTVHTARGIIAIGQRARGVVACGIIATGFLSIGAVSFGVLSIGVVAIGLAAACGVNAVAPAAFGVAAIGLKAHGLQALSVKF